MTQGTAARRAERFPFRQRILSLAWLFTRGLLPYPDLFRRRRVRRRARNLVTCEPWPGMDAKGSDAAQLALLRLLYLQRQTRRAVRGRHREASVMLARAAVETCILGLWCLNEDTAVAVLQAANVKALSNMAVWLTAEGLVPPEVMARMVDTLGQPGRAPKVWDMAQAVDQAVGGTGATSLYRRLYVPASNLFTHANAGSLLRHVTTNDRLATRPSRAWTRRAPIRTADAAAGLLAFHIARSSHAADASLFAQYAEAHLSRVPPPLVVIAGINYGRSLSLKQVITMIKAIRAVGAYNWSEQATADTLDERKARIRDGLVTMLNLPELGIPADAGQAFIEYLAAAVAERDTPGTDRPDA